MPKVKAIPAIAEGSGGGEVYQPRTVCDTLRNPEAEHTVETRHVECRVCGKDVEYRWHSSYPILKPTVCDGCYDKATKHREAQKSLQSLPFGEWDFKKGNNALLKHLLTTSLGSTKPEEGKWPLSMFIHGRTGLCKTRAVCEAAKRWGDVGGVIKYLSAHKGMSKYSELLGVSMADAGRYQNSISGFHGLLIIDDLGVGAITERSLEWLFAIVDGRLTDNLPTWITSNYDYSRLQKWIGRSDSEYGDRVVRRIADLCIVVNSEEVK